MYCKKCGATIDDDSVFCSNCGTKQNIIEGGNQTDIQKSEQIVESKIVNVNLSFGNRSAPSAKSPNTVKISKYDTNYQRETEATIFGIIIIVATFLVFGIGGNHLSSNPAIAPIISIAGLIFRIIATVWVVNVAGRQNRDKTNWGFFSFFLPSLALIIIGLNRKIKKENIDTADNQNSKDTSNIYVKQQNQTDSEDFLGSTLYWLLLIGIPLLIVIIIFIANRQ